MSMAGDILFIDSTPLIWAGPVSNWIKACDLITAMDVDTIVPGHGPITDKKGVAAGALYDPPDNTMMKSPDVQHITDECFTHFFI